MVEIQLQLAANVCVFKRLCTRVCDYALVHACVFLSACARVYVIMRLCTRVCF